jgi:2'-5' RNA ligase
MRLFTAIDVPYETRRNLELLIEHLRPTAALAWSPPANMHITTKFIGDLPDEEVPALKRALGDVEVEGELKVAIQGLGWFPNMRQPRVLYAGVQAYDGLKNLAQATDLLCTELGIMPEVKAYHPHLTLARIRRPEDMTALHEAIAKLPSNDFGRFTATQFHLYESKLRSDGASYTKLASYALKK